MIDVDRFEEQLDLALTPELRSAIGLVAASPAPKALIETRRDRGGSEFTMALLEGRIEAARTAARAELPAGPPTRDPNARDRFWVQQYWVVLDWGDSNERYELLDECRQRAYGRNDLYWRSALALLCARMGRSDEAAREFDASFAKLDGVTGNERLDIVTNLIEAAALLSDPARGRSLKRAFASTADPILFDDRASVCKGAATRYQAQLNAASWQWDECDRAFQAAVDTHRSIGALPLVARTLHEWGLYLTGRGDPRAWHLLTESTDLARGLGMTGAISGTPEA